MNTENRNNSLKDWKLVNFCEFDPYAIKSYCAIHNVDKSLNLGDITKVDETKLDDFDLMTWGFPCTDISVAGNQVHFHLNFCIEKKNRYSKIPLWILDIGVSNALYGLMNV